jgi:hypothetical protein
MFVFGVYLLIHFILINKLQSITYNELSCVCVAVYRRHIKRIYVSRVVIDVMEPCEKEREIKN